MYFVNERESKINNLTYYIYLLGFMSLSLIGLFIFKLKDSFNPNGGQVDRSIIEYLFKSRHVYMDKFFVFISRSGDTLFAITVTLIIIIFFYHISKKREAYFYATNILAIAIISQGLKYIAKRPRPEGKWLVDISGYTHVGGYSFPSGHSMISMAGALILVYFILDHFRNRILAHILSILVFAYAILVGVSRVYVGVHYPSDVLGAWVIASVWVLVTLIMFRRKRKSNIRYI